MSGEGEAWMPAALVERVLRSASDDVVLVGGQSLAFWMSRYGIRDPGGRPAISRDVDFFTRDATNVAPLYRFAKAIGGQARIMPMRAITALMGSAVAPAGEDRVHNVDLIHTVFGLDRDHVLANSMQVITRDGARFRVMHPLDVLQSRNINLHKLADKQDALGQLQFRLSIEVARVYLEQCMDELERDSSLEPAARERAILDPLQVVLSYASESAARKNATRYEIYLADAIPAWRIRSPAFWERQWPHLRQRMSPEHAAECERRRPAA